MVGLMRPRAVAWTAAAVGICVAALAALPQAEAQPMRRPGMQQQDGAPQGHAAPGGMQGGGMQRPEGAPGGAAQGGAAQGGAAGGGMARVENEVPRWIDTHVHLVSGITNTTGDWAGAVRVALADMDKNNIAMAFVMPTPQPPGDNFYDIADFAETLRKHPARFAFLGGGGTLSPLILYEPDAETVSEATRKKFADIAHGIIDAGAVGFGEMAATHLSHADAHAYHRARPDHPLFLLLAEIAAQRNVVIDLHMDLVIEQSPLPAKFKELSQRNPPVLTANLAQFERLLAHERNARIVWAHAGADHTGVLSVDVIRRLMRDHPNLYMSIKALAQSPEPNMMLAREGRLRPEWRRLIAEFPDRFVIGTDRFYGSSSMGMPAGAGAGKNVKASAGAIFIERTVPLTQAGRNVLSQLPPQLAQRVAFDNVKAIYRLP
jgi:hypothetical protein